MPVPAAAAGGPPLRRPAWMDQPPRSDTDLDRLGARAAGDWAATATDADHAELLVSRPILPADLDRRLLRTASNLGGVWLTETERRTLRYAFWTAVVDLTPGQHSPEP